MATSTASRMMLKLGYSEIRSKDPQNLQILASSTVKQEVVALASSNSWGPLGEYLRISRL
jgi:hypothetical protein